MKEFKSQSLSIQAKKGKQLDYMMPAIEKAFDLIGDDKKEMSDEKKSLKKIGSYDEKLLEESKAELFKLIDDKKRAILILSGMEKQM